MRPSSYELLLVDFDNNENRLQTILPLVRSRALSYTKKDSELTVLSNHHTCRRVVRRSQPLWRWCLLEPILFFDGDDVKTMSWFSLVQGVKSVSRVPQLIAKVKLLTFFSQH